MATRPKTLPAAIVPVWLGCVLAWKSTGVWSPWLAICTLGSAMAIQIASNFFNDAIDARKGADTAARIGPQRVTASGLLSPALVMGMGVLALLVAAALAWPLIAARGWPILAIGLPSLYFSFGYTGGPFPLAYRGLGEGFVMLFFGWIAVLGSVFVQTGKWMPHAILLGTQVGALSTALIAINNLRDAAEDATTGKRTLAVRFGVLWAKKETTILLLLPFVLGLLWWPLGHSGLALGPLLALPLAAGVTRRVSRDEPGPGHNLLLAKAGATLVLFAIGFHLGAFL
ncbi:MAG: 1,4-dihydroxy-2-naphthoate octaprenyltransferase [Verrucomicrobiales bacterium]